MISTSAQKRTEGNNLAKSTTTDQDETHKLELGQDNGALTPTYHVRPSS